VGDLFDVESLFPQLVLALGAALVVGNGLALWQAQQGRRPPSAPGPLRRGRAWLLAGVGLLMTLWAIATLAN